MIYQFLLAIILCSHTAFGAVIIENKKDKLEVNPFATEPEIKLPKAALKALTTWNAKFKPFDMANYTKSIKKLFIEREKNEVPMAFVSDLDGDKVDDMAILGQDDKKQYAIVLRNKKNKWTVSVVNTWDYADVEKSEVPGDSEKEYGIPFYILPSQNEQKGLQIETYMGATQVYKL